MKLFDKRSPPSKPGTVDFPKPLVVRQRSRKPLTRNDDRPAQFFDCEAWKGTAEAISHAHKGDEVYILGALKQNTWTNAEGKQRSKVTVIAWNAEFFGKPKAQLGEIGRI